MFQKLLNLKKKFYIENTFLIFLGVVTSFSLPPFNFILINFISFSLFFLFLLKKLNQKKNLWQFFLFGWLFGFGYFFSSLYWVPISLTFDKNFKFLIPIAIILIPSFLALFYGMFCFLFAIIKLKDNVSSLLIFSLLFGIVEFLRGIVLTGFPWNLIAFSFSNHLEILNIISIIGTYGFNLICISFFTSPALIFLKDKKKNIVFFSIFIFIFVIFFFNGLYSKEKFQKLEKKVLDYKIRTIGSKISIDRFYSNVNSVLVIEELIKLSEPNLKEKIIFIWPEGILPEISQNELKEYNWLFNKKFNKNHLILMGINSEKTEDSSLRYFNSFSIYDNDLNLINSYNKINLVPFGEFLPFEKLLRGIGLKSLTNNYQSFSAGKERKVLDIKRENFSLKFLPLICYEIIYSGGLYTDSNFDIIINISEDGWFGQSIGPKQHFVHSIFRAIESGKYVIRSANNGISAIINPIGIVEKKIPFGQVGYLDFEVKRKIQPTIFSLFGNKIFGLLILLYIFLVFSFNRIKNE